MHTYLSFIYLTIVFLLVFFFKQLWILTGLTTQKQGYVMSNGTLYIDNPQYTTQAAITMATKRVVIVTPLVAITTANNKSP